MPAVLPVYRDRPAVLPFRGGDVFVSVHDAEYLRQRSEWRRRLKESASDTGGSDFRARRVIKGYKRWQALEAERYAQYGLTPPDPPKPPRVSSVPCELLLLARGRTGRTRRAVQDYLAAHPHSTNAEVATALGITNGHVATVKCVAKVPLRETASTRLIALLSDGACHSTAACRAAVNGRTKSALSSAVSRLRALGFDIRTTYYGVRQPTTYQLLAGQS